jgi:hypothetical protein
VMRLDKALAPREAVPTDGVAGDRTSWEAGVPRSWK